MEEIIKLISNENLMTVFIGFLGVIISIVVFIATVINDKKMILEKRTIIEVTHIKDYISDTVAILLYALVINTIKPDSNGVILNYYITHTLLLFFVIYSFIRTIIIFNVTLKIILQEDYFQKKIEKYLYKKLIINDKKASKKLKKKMKEEKKSFNSFIYADDFYCFNVNEAAKNSDFVPIYPSLSGIVRCFNTHKLEQLKQEYLNNRYIKENESDMASDKVYIFNCIGKKVNKKTPVFYCKKNGLYIFKELVNTIEYENNRMFLDDEVDLINDNMESYAMRFSPPQDFDDNNQLYDYFKYLYNKGLSGIRYSAIEKLYSIGRKVKQNVPKNSSFCSFLSSIASMAYEHNQFIEYKKVIDIELYLFCEQLKENADEKSVAFEFVNSIFKYQIYSVKNDNRMEYYDYLLSILFKFIASLMKEHRIEAINVILDNIYMDYYQNSDNDINNIDKYNFQFCYGIVAALTILVQIDPKAEISNFKKLLMFIRNMLSNLYNAWDVIRIFRQERKEKTCINEVIKDLEFIFADHKYKNSWSFNILGEQELLKNFLICLKLSYCMVNEEDKNSIQKEDKFYFQSLLEKLSKNTQLEEITSTDYIADNVIESINEVVEMATQKEKEYNRSHSVDNNTVEQFEKKVVNSLKDLHLNKKLEKYQKIQYTSEKKPVVYGISQLLPRELFFKEVYGLEMFSDDCISVFNSGIEKDFLKKIEQMSTLCEEQLESHVKKLDKLEEFILITDDIFVLSQKFTINPKDNIISIEGKKLEFMLIQGAKSAYLLKKTDLPIIMYCSFDDSKYESANIHDSVFFELIDCAKSEKIRNEIINNSDWIKEKGTYEDQNSYLQEKFSLRVFLSYKIQRIKGAKGLKFSKH